MLPTGLVEKSPECREGELGHEERSLYVDMVEGVGEVLRNRLNGVCGETVILKWEDGMQ